MKSEGNRIALRLTACVRAPGDTSYSEAKSKSNITDRPRIEWMRESMVEIGVLRLGMPPVSVYTRCNFSDQRKHCD